MGDLQVQVLMGSGSDADVMASTVRTLRDLGITCDMTVASAHRSPDRVRRVMETALGRGVQVFVVGAGAAAHLAGVVAAHTVVPVIGVPIDSSPLGGFDAQLGGDEPRLRSQRSHYRPTLPPAGLPGRNAGLST